MPRPDRRRLASDLTRMRIRRANRSATIAIGAGTHFGPGFRLNMQGEGRLEIGEDVEFRHGTVIEMNWASRVVIGARTQFTYFNVIQAMVSIEIGAGCMLAPFATVVDGAHRFGSDELPLIEAGYDHSSVTIGDGVWISSKSTVNADVGAHAVIGANSLVIREVPAGAFVGGVPARPLRSSGRPAREDHVLEDEERA